MQNEAIANGQVIKKRLRQLGSVTACVVVVVLLLVGSFIIAAMMIGLKPFVY